MSQNTHRFTPLCRLACTLAIASPLLYRLGTGDDAYHFLVLLILASIAGPILVLNSLVCLIRYRKTESWWIGIGFIVVGFIGGFEVWYYLPQFRM